MANARTRYDTISEYLVRAHECALGQLYGKPCVMKAGHAFCAYAFLGMAFRLKGRVRLQAMALPGAKFWDPLGRSDPQMDWVLVPVEHFLRWDRFAIEAVRLAEEGKLASLGPKPERAPDAAADPALRSVRDIAPPKFRFANIWKLVPIFGRGAGE